MSSPTPGSDPNYPQGGAPQGYGGTPPNPAPGYNPAAQYSGAPAGYGGPAGQRPTQVTAAGIIGVVIGGLGALAGLFSLLGLGLIFSVDAFLGILVLLSFAAAIVVLIGGIQVLTGKAPKLLLFGSYGAIGVTVLTWLWGLISGYGFLFGGFLTLVAAIVVMVMLLQPQSKQYFAARGMPY